MVSFAGILKRNLSSKEVESILDLLPEPALLWDAKQDEFTAFNPLAIELTGYTRKDLHSVTFLEVFPTLKNALPITNSLETNTILMKHNLPLFPVKIKLKSIAPNNQWVLITFKAEKDIYQREAQQSIQGQRWEALHALSLASLQKNLSTSFNQALQAGQLLTGCSFLAIYLPGESKNGELKLSQKWGQTNFLPDTIKQNEISHLRIPFIWQPGTRTTSIFHQKALAAQLKYLATCPIDQTAPFDGILVSGDQISPPPDDLIQMLQILTGAMVSSLEHHQEIISTTTKLENLTNQLAILQKIKDQIADGVIYTDINHAIIDVNESASLSLLYSKDEIISKPIEQILVCDCELREILSTIKSESAELHELGEIKVHRRDGQQILTHIRIIPVPESNEGQNAANVILISDLTVREEFRNRAKQLESQAIVGELMAIFAHEVRNPINNIRMGLEVLASNYLEKEDMTEEFERLLNDIDRLEDLMKSILSSSRPREYKMGPVNLRGLIESLLYRWKPRMARYKIVPDIQSTDPNLLVKGDKRSLEQVFTNLVQNAINAMRNSGGKLSIRIADQPNSNTVSIDISDTGPGIPAEILDRIFEPFFTTNQDGNGLGLAITKQIINVHNGQISVNSVPGGTVFRITLPKEQNLEKFLEN
jgi:PAS domain S-box-containing protein